jgi:hypothetical protein
MSSVTHRTLGAQGHNPDTGVADALLCGGADRRSLRSSGRPRSFSDVARAEPLDSLGDPSRGGANRHWANAGWRRLRPDLGRGRVCEPLHVRLTLWRQCTGRAEREPPFARRRSGANLNALAGTSLRSPNFRARDEEASATSDVGATALEAGGNRRVCAASVARSASRVPGSLPG